MTDYTTHLSLVLPEFDQVTWHDDVNNNFSMLDSIFYAMTGLQIRGTWANSTVYVVSDRVLDTSNDTLYICQVGHTSASTGTFAADRAANPTYWTVISQASTAASFVVFTPYGNIAASDVQAALEELDDEKQPLDADLTAVAALSTTSYGRNFLTLADEAALAALLTSSYQPLDADLTALAAVATQAYGRSLLATANEAALHALINLEIGTDIQAYSANLDSWSAVNESAYYNSSEVDSGFQPLDADLTAIAAVSTTAYGRALLALANDTALQSLLIDETFIWTGPHTFDEAVNFLHDIEISGVITPSQITGNTNDYQPSGYAESSVWKLDSDGDYDLTGISLNQANRLLILHNIGANTITLKDEDANSTAENRFILNVDVPIGPDQSVIIWYDGVSDRWRMVGIFAAGGGGGAPTSSSYITVSSDGSLSAERVLTAGEGIDLTDGGANSTITIDCEDASTTNKGVAELATAVEAEARSDTERALTPSSVANFSLIATGTYTGNDTDAQGITGVGFQPVALWIVEEATDGNNSAIAFTTDTLVTQDADGLAWVAAPTGGGSNTCEDRTIASLDTDGFTVDQRGGNRNFNSSGTTYHYLAWG